MNYLRSNDPLLVVIGPSGSGKSSVVQELVNRRSVEVTPSWTTRPPRNGESDQLIEHMFVDEKEFNKQRVDNFFLEVVQLFDLPYRYGLPRIQQPDAHRVPLIMLRATLLPLLPNHYSAATIYQIEDTLSKVQTRLKLRQTDGEHQGSRLSDYQKEVNLGQKLAHRVFTNDAGILQLADDIERAMVEDFGQK